MLPLKSVGSFVILFTKTFTFPSLRHLGCEDGRFTSHTNGLLIRLATRYRKLPVGFFLLQPAHLLPVSLQSIHLKHIVLFAPNKTTAIVYECNRKQTQRMLR